MRGAFHYVKKGREISSHDLLILITALDSKKIVQPILPTPFQRIVDTDLQVMTESLDLQPNHEAVLNR